CATRIVEDVFSVTQPSGALERNSPVVFVCAELACGPLVGVDPFPWQAKQAIAAIRGIAANMNFVFISAESPRRLYTVRSEFGNGTHTSGVLAVARWKRRTERY